MIPEQTVVSRFTPGAICGKYRIIHEIGRGGMGVVYLAEDTSLGRHVALKVLRTAWNLDEDVFTQRFRLEARAIAALCHPYIVRIHAFETIAGRPVIDMEYLPGGSLADRLASGPIPMADTLAITHHVLEALSQCHAIGTVHRDVKPSNILIDSQGHPRLTDFGLAKAMAAQLEVTLQSGASSGFFLGTPRYAPPEAWEGVDPSPAWDVYSLGMVVYESIAGGPVFDAANPLALVKQVSSRPVPPLVEKAPHVSPELNDLVLEMLQPDPSDRPADARAALERFMTVPECASHDWAHPSTVTVRSHSSTFRRANRLKRAIAKWRPRIPWTELIIASLGVAALLAFPRWQEWRKSSAPPAPPSVQAAVVLDTLPDEHGLLRLSKALSPASYLRFNVHLVEAPEVQAQWLMLRPQEPNATAPIVFFTPTYVSWLEMRMGRDRKAEFKGFFAEYLPQNGNAFRQGEVSGMGFWPTDSDPLIASLSYVCEDGTRWKWTASSMPLGPSATDTEFLHAFEAADLLQPLLYNEILQRQLAWGKQLEDLLPCVAKARAIVPFVPNAVKEITIDGRLDEPGWLKRHFGTGGRTGLIEGRPGPRLPELRMRFCAAGLFLAAQARRPLGPHTELRIDLLRRFTVPIRDSERWEVAYLGQDWIETHYMRGGVEQDWECDWKIASHATNDDWTAEIFVPFDPAGPLAPPRPEERWRLNCTVSDVSDPAMPKPLLQWGFPDPAQVEHGAVLVFGSRLMETPAP